MRRDVYKRQVRPSESTVESRIPPRMKVRTGASLETVSYTHLDVYKRQPLFGSMVQKG